MRRASQSQADRRVERTQGLILDAFFSLVQQSRFDELKTSEIIEAAGVGKSTFYEHFADKNDLLKHSLRGPFTALAQSHADTDGAIRVLKHFWDRRSLSRIILSGQTKNVVVSCLADVLQTTYPVSSASETAMIVSRAAGLVAVLANWLAGSLEMSAKDLAGFLARETATLRSPAPT